MAEGTLSGMRVLVAGASPDEINRNAFVRRFVARGFRELEAVDAVHEVPYESAASIAREWSYDLSLVFGSVWPDRCDYARIADVVHRGGGRLAFWLHDDPYEFDHGSRVLPLADLVFTNDRSSLRHYPADVDVEHLPLAACPVEHRRTPAVRPSARLFFCGHQFENRRRFLADLGALVGWESLQVVGTGWDHAAIPIAVEGLLPNARLADSYAESIAVLDIGRDRDLSNRRFQIRPSTPGPRTFEAAMAGGAQLRTGDGLEICDYFEPGSEVVLVESAGEAAEWYRRLLHRPETSLAIGRRAQERALAEHTYRHRAASILARFRG
jgi:spore maturation protein CgeB